MSMLPVAVSELERFLPEYITKQRWYRAKAKTLTRLQVRDTVPLSENARALLLELAYTDGDSATYLLPLTSEQSAEPLGPTGLYNALASQAFRELLLEAIACNRAFDGENGRLKGSRTRALQRECNSSDPAPQSKVSRAEQSNSSIIFGNEYILKLFRKLESGVNPDLEIGRFLTEHGFKYTPAVLGELTYEAKQGEAMHAGILQAFVRNEGDAWEYTLESLKGFFVRALQNGKAPQIESYHPMQLCDEELPAVARQTIGDYLESARVLGTRTAQMHVALADPQGGPDFAPEPFGREHGEPLYQEMLNQAEVTFDLLPDKQNMLSGETAQSARRLISKEPEVRSRFESLRNTTVHALRIRHHGDYHLGQVLYTGDDFVIIDFEGEPARPLTQRRAKTLAMKDVAGMIRSFSYAAHAALFGQVEGVPNDVESKPDVEAWASFWAAWVGAAYLKAYFETAAKAPFVGSGADEHRLLFDAFVLQKALYEVAYELNNRPDWVQIPLRGILTLID